MCVRGRETETEIRAIVIIIIYFVSKKMNTILSCDRRVHIRNECIHPRRVKSKNKAIKKIEKTKNTQLKDEL